MQVTCFLHIFCLTLPVPLGQVNNKKTLVRQSLLCCIVQLIQFDLLSGIIFILPQMVYVFVTPSGQLCQFLS